MLNRQVILYISNSYQKVLLSIDTGFFTASAEWCLPSEAASNPMLWMVSIDGLVFDARMLPVEIQEICYEKGLIPFVPAYKKEP